jgi:Rod binding domain-containing protein
MISEARSLSSASVAPSARGAAILAPSSMQKGAAAGPAAESPAGKKLRQAAAEFEGMLLSNLWKSMKSTFAESDEDTDDPAHETLSDMGIQAMTGAVGKAGGLGLGKLIIKHLEPLLMHDHNGNAPHSSGKASALPADTFLESRSHSVSIFKDLSAFADRTYRCLQKFPVGL